MTDPSGRVEFDGAGPALFQLVRLWSRRWVMRVSEEVSGQDRYVQNIVVLDAVDAAARHSAEVSVADVAHQLGLDHSGASRFVSAAIERGYLQRGVSSEDSRRAALTISEAGQDLLTAAHAWQDQMSG